MIQQSTVFGSRIQVSVRSVESLMKGVLGFTKIGLTKPTVLAACRIYYERGAGFGEHFLVAKKVSNF